MFVQRAIIGMLYPIVYRFVTINNVGRVFGTILNGLMRILFTTLVRYFINFMRYTITGYQAGNLLLPNNIIGNAVLVNGLVPTNYRSRVAFVALILGLLGRISFFCFNGFKYTGCIRSYVLHYEDLWL